MGTVGGIGGSLLYKDPALLDRIADEIQAHHDDDIPQCTQAPCRLADAEQAVNAVGQQHLGRHLGHGQKIILEHGLAGLLLGLEDHLLIQEEVQKNGMDVTYVLASEEGPEHDKTFFVEAYQGETLIGKGNGRSKKAAEQQAAYEALKKGIHRTCI